MVFFSGRNRNGFDVDLDNAVGLALQAGVDVPLQNAWTLNADVKKVFVKTDASINGGALKGSVKLDPWVLSLGGRPSVLASPRTDPRRGGSVRGDLRQGRRQPVAPFGQRRRMA